MFKRVQQPHLSAQSLDQLNVPGVPAVRELESYVSKMLPLTEAVRREILLPSAEAIKTGALEIERKDTGDGRAGDAKTVTVETDHLAESRMIELQRQVFPEAFIIGEEVFGDAPTKQKLEMLSQVLDYEGTVILNDTLDGTRPFTKGKDGFSSMISVVENGAVVASIVHFSTSHEREDKTGYTLTWEKGDNFARYNGEPLVPLSERSMPLLAGELRGYAGFEFLKGTDALHAVYALTDPPNLRHRFDSLSDRWTCGTLYRDLLFGHHDFMIVPPPVDIFDYPMGIAMLQGAGGVARFVDGTDATLGEIISRQGFGKPSYDPKNLGAEGSYVHLIDPANYRAMEQSLILATSEDTFGAVLQEFKEGLLERRRGDLATRLYVDGFPASWAYR